MNWVLDLGNTRSKWAVFDGKNKLSDQSVPGSIDESTLKEVLDQYPNLSHCILSSVVNHDLELETRIREKMKLVVLDTSTPLPFTNAYTTPETLGKDRLAAAAGAWTLFPNEAVLSIDFGTCIKYDFVNPDGHYLGGAISPGLNMRFKSLHTDTDKLPLLHLDRDPKLIGNTTESSILSGVVQGITFEVSGAIGAYREHWGNLNIIFTGGDHQYFAKAFKNSIFARPDLTLIGLNRILEYHENH